MLKRLLLLSTVLLVTSGCRLLVPQLPKVNLAEPSWQVREGQAIWHLANRSTEIAGEVLVASRPDHQTFVQFSKVPFPLVVGQSAGNVWTVEFPTQGKHYSGRGHPPKRLLWLYLARVLAGESPPSDCTWKHEGTSWRLANQKTGEALEGYFAQ
jgi:hypothetical protein